MRRQLLETYRQTLSTVEALPDKLIGVGVEVTECVAVFIPFNGEFSTFCSLGQT